MSKKFCYERKTVENGRRTTLQITYCAADSMKRTANINCKSIVIVEEVM